MTQSDEPQDLARGRQDPEADDAERRDQPDDRDEDDADDRQSGGELAVDDVVAVDRLGEEAGQRPAGPLAVHRVEREGDPEQRRDDPEEPRDRRQRDLVGDVGGVPEQRDEDRRRAAVRLGRGSDRVRDEVERDGGDEAQDEEQDDEARGQQVVRELLPGDDHPAGPGDGPLGSLRCRRGGGGQWTAPVVSPPVLRATACR